MRVGCIPRKLSSTKSSNLAGKYPFLLAPAFNVTRRPFEDSLTTLSPRSLNWNIDTSSSVEGNLIARFDCLLDSFLIALSSSFVIASASPDSLFAFKALRSKRFLTRSLYAPIRSLSPVLFCPLYNKGIPSLLFNTPFLSLFCLRIMISVGARLPLAIIFQTKEASPVDKVPLIHLSNLFST